MSNPGTGDWHALEAGEVLQRLSTKRTGISGEEAARRLEKYGLNQLQEEKRVSPLRIFVDQFRQFLIIILLIATTISLLLGEVADAVVIFAIVIASAVLGFVQEYRASQAVDALKKLVTTTVEVLRDGHEKRVKSAEIVLGDIMILSPGDRVTADARIIEANNVKVNESALTGEAEAVTKDTSLLAPDTGVYARRNMVFAGTVLTYGRARAVVVSTGMSTEFGKIASMLETMEVEATPLEKRMDGLGRTLGIISFIVVAVVFSLGILRGNDLLEMFLWSVSLAVAAVPEALPAVVTGSLARGMQVMAKKKAIVKRLPAVETLGSTSVICSDKTGTLTKGEMTVREIFVDRRKVEVTGVGYVPEGEFRGGEPDRDGPFVKVATLCNDARLVRSENGWDVEGDPTEGALVVLAAKLGVDQRSAVGEFPRLGEVVFSSERKIMTTVHRTPDGRLIAYMKGAPEIVLQRCKSLMSDGHIHQLTKEERREILAENENMAKRALRVLGFAYREIPSEWTEFDEKLEQNMVFTGLAGMIDPPREEAKRAVALCAEAGIRTIMITGDNEHTASAVAKELGISGGRTATGEEIGKISDDDLDGIVEEVSVYARVSPSDKMRLVKALKRKGRVVAATGDGVNDAPALKAADIGVAMGITGTEATKEAGDMILLDDNFATLVSAVEQGRVIYSNIKKFLAYLLSSNVGELLIMLSAGLTGLPLPLITIQILWVNLVTDGLPAIALGVDPPEEDIMRFPPRRPDETVFTSGIMAIILVVSVLMAVTLIPVFYLYDPTFEEVALLKARTVIFTAIVMFEMFNTFNCRSERQSVFSVGPFKNRYLLLALLSSVLLQLVVVYHPQIQPYFGTVALDLLDWLIVLGVSVTGLIGVEAAKAWLRRRK